MVHTIASFILILINDGIMHENIGFDNTEN